MAYTTPKTWTNEPLIAADLNTHLRDNLEALKDPPGANYECNEVADYSTTSASFVDVDATNLALSMITNGGDVMLHFHGVVAHSLLNTNSVVQFNIDVDGSPHAANDGIMAVYCINGAANVSFTRLITGLAAGSHTFKLQWKNYISGTATLYAGAGTTKYDVHPQFWVREVS
jgi:hypothetical protein